MDYKEKYEKALAKAKEQYNYPAMASSMGILEDIFPELKESEDERIRKALLEMVHDTTGDELWVDYNVHKEEVLAWLEAQGEPTYIPADAALDSNKDGLIADTIRYKREKQGEQKPADETPYPETLEKAIDLYYYSYGNGEGEFEHLSLEKFRDIVHTFVSDYGQNPAWSEKDETALGDALWCCKQAANIAKDENDMGNVWYAENWLKSLKDRYTWKPSDEQMLAINTAINVIGKGTLNGKQLIELYQDLKKLREEQL